MNCESARAAIHATLDGPVDAASIRGLQDHLRSCAGCRDAEAELRAIVGALRELPQATLPAPALDAVWDRTVRVKPYAKSRARGLRTAAALLLVGVTAVGLWRASRPRPEDPTEAELRAAAEQTRLALGLTAEALRRTERRALRTIRTTAEEVSGALRRIPVGRTASEDSEEEG